MYDRKSMYSALFAIVACANVILSQIAAADDSELAGTYQVLTKYCLPCHSKANEEAGLRLDLVMQSNSLETDLAAWKEVLHRLEFRDMPPEGNPRPQETEYESAINPLRQAFEESELRLISKQPRSMRRLNRDEYANTMRDLFGIRFRPGDDFPIDNTWNGFDTVADGLNLSTSLVDKYIGAASAVLDRAMRPMDSNQKPRINKSIFHEEKHHYPPNTELGALSVYNGNAHLTFESEGKKRIVYIGGPALFSYSVIDPIGNTAHAFNTEGVYKLRVSMIPRGFEKNEVASFTILGPEKRLCYETDVTIHENGRPIVLEAEGYYDRTDSLVGFEVQWTNGNHLQWPSRGRLLKLPFDNSDQNKPWWHINYRIDAGKRIDWKPSQPEELPFSYFERVEFEIAGPIRETPIAVSKILGSYEQDYDASKVFERFLPQAFRRKIHDSEVLRYASLVQKQREKGLDPIEALKIGMSAALCSPHFLLIVEDAPPEAEFGGYTLSDHELATRLSYFLWSSCPDEELRAVADSGRLREHDVFHHQVTRMLADPKIESFVQRFTRQWLNLDRLASSMPEPKLFPMWSDDLRDSSRLETIFFFREVLATNGPVTDFLSSDWIFANEVLASHYGLPETQGRKLQKIWLPDNRRGGLISQASILTLTSEATRTSPVIRGAYVLDRFFHRPPPSPPANVSTLIPDASEAKSVREHLEIHRSNIACAGCHAKFDGYGLALENFDATGRWRIEEPAYEDPAKPISNANDNRTASFPINTSVELHDGSRFDGVDGLKQHLLSRKDEFVRGLAERLLIYACGRKLISSDRAHVDEIARKVATDNYRFHSLIRAVAESAPFRTR